MLTGKLGQHADSHSSSCEDSFPSWLSCQKHNILNRLQCGQFLGLMESDSDSQFSVVLEGGGNISGTEVVVEEGDEVVLEDAEIGIREASRAGAVSTLDFSKVFEDGGNNYLHGFSGFSGVYDEGEGEGGGQALGKGAKESFRAGGVLDEDLGNQTLRKVLTSKNREESMETEDETMEGEEGGGGGGGDHTVGERTIQLNSLDNIGRFIDEARPGSVERRSGVDAIVVKSWGDVYLTGIGLFGASQPGKPLSVHLRIFCNSNLLWEFSNRDWRVNQWGTIDVEPPLLLGSRWRYLIVARVAGGPCWQGVRGRPLYTLPRSWGRATQLAFHDPEEKLLAAALYDDEVPKICIPHFHKYGDLEAETRVVSYASIDSSRWRRRPRRW